MTRRYGGGSGGGGGGSASSTSTSSSGNLGADVHASLGLLPNGELKQETYADRVARVGGIDRVGVIFLFPPVGWQRINMGRALYEKDRTFRHSIEACDAASRALLPQPLLEVLYPAPADEAMYSEVMAAPTYMLSALFAVEYALHALLRNQACEPFAVIGHSLGEFVAATVAGVLTLQSSLELVVERGRAMPCGGVKISDVTPGRARPRRARARRLGRRGGRAGGEGRGGAGGGGRARSHCRGVLPLNRFIPDSLRYSVPLFPRR